MDLFRYFAFFRGLQPAVCVRDSVRILRRPFRTFQLGIVVLPLLRLNGFHGNRIDESA